MQIVTDRGADIAPQSLTGLPIHFAPLTITLDGKTYRGGEDISPEEFYQLLASSSGFPVTSQPSPGDFANLYRKLAVDDPEILSIHLSSGLSGTIKSARLAADMVPEADVTFYDTKMLSAAEGWHVEAAARAAVAGWSKAEILSLLAEITASTEMVFTLATLKYLVHGGRVSHLKGLIGALLRIKPVIGVEKARGTYVTLGQSRTYERAIGDVAKQVAGMCPEGLPIRVQLMHGKSPDAVARMHDHLEELITCRWLPTVSIAPVLGAHTGPAVIGVAFAPEAVFAQIP